MFTGIIEEQGTVKDMTESPENFELTIYSKGINTDMAIGDSISINGICLTVTNFSTDSFSVDFMPETLNKTSLKYLEVGDEVNLERALKADSRIGGHIVSGHIDGVGEILKIEADQNATWYQIKPQKELLKYIIYKGSIAVDGISLTIASVDEETFSVSIIPHTQAVTNLSDKKVGDIINLEADVLGKHVEKLLQVKENT